MKKKILIALILILGIGIGVGATLLVSNLIQDDEEETKEETKYYEILKDQNITVKNYNQEAYTIDNLPETVDVKISGSKKKVKKAMEEKEVEVVLDLEDIEASSEEIEVELTCEIDGVSCEVEPEKITIIIDKKISKVKTLSYELLNEDSLEDLTIDSIDLYRSDVVIKGSEESLKKVATIKALIDLDSKKVLKAGSYIFDKNMIIAYDKYGDIINNIEIVPSTVDASLEVIEVYSKEVPIKVNLLNPAPDNKAIRLVSINGKEDFKVKLYGEEEYLEKIDELEVIIDVKDIEEKEKTYKVDLQKPNRVRKMSVDSLEIVVKVD